MKKEKKSALFGGSFDPVHLGHIQIAKKALNFADEVIIMPNYLNPLKHSFSAPPNLRYKWLKKVFKNFKNIKVSTWETEKQRPVYSIETIKHFRPDFFIIGSDNLKGLDKWYKIDEILNLTEFIVATRGEVDKNLLKKYNITKLIEIDITISSTEIRNCNFKYIPKEIEKEIKEFYGQNCKNKRVT
ncbi:MAG: nicotinate (nicotinamide) nucleotide adenylyltransferase [Nautiliaceae bacterium]